MNRSNYDQRSGAGQQLKGISGGRSSGGENQYGGGTRDRGSEQKGFEEFEENLKQIGEKVKDRGRELVQQVGGNVRQNPWVYVGGAALVILGLGFLFNRRT